MSPADMCNAAFELFGGVFVLNHCRVLFEAKIVKGISIVSTVFFTAWGVWNLYYYPSLGQWASFAGGVFICLTNLLWVAMLVYYRRNPGPVRRVVCAANRSPDGLVVCGPRHFDSVIHAQLRAAGTYGNITVDAKGRVTAIAALTAANIPTLDWSKIGTGKPTTLAGFGITDALSMTDIIDGGEF